VPVLTSLARNDVNTLVRAAAITSLGDLKLAGNMDLFRQSLNSQSYAVAGAALTAISKLDATESLKLAKNIEKDSGEQLTQAIMNVYATNGNSDQWAFMLQAFQQASGRAKFGLMDKFGGFTGRVDSPADAQQGIAELEKLGRSSKRLSRRVLDILSTIKEKREKMNDNASAQAADNAIKAIKG
jgi:aminopeptidase N